MENEELNVTFEKSAFNGELKYKLVSTDKMVREICKTFSAMTNDFIGAKFILADRPVQSDANFMNAQIDGINNFIFNASNIKSRDSEDNELSVIPEDETQKAYGATNILRQYVAKEESNKEKPNGEHSYVALYFMDNPEGDGKVKFVLPKDKIIQKTSNSKMGGWISAWNRRNDFKYFGLTSDAKKCLEGFVPLRINPTNQKATTDKRGMIWENLYDVKTVTDLYYTGAVSKQYNVCIVPIDIRRFFSMIYGKKVEGSNEKYEYDFTLMLPSNPYIFQSQMQRNNFILNVVQVDGERSKKYMEENGISTNTNKLGFIGLTGL